MNYYHTKKMKREVECEAQISVKYVRHGKAVFSNYRCSRHRTYEALQKYLSSKEDFRFAIVYKFRKGQGSLSGWLF